jgi:hypothetical protein
MKQVQLHQSLMRAKDDTEKNSGVEKKGQSDPQLRVVRDGRIDLVVLIVI